MDWLALLTMTFFSVGLVMIWEMAEMSCVSESVSCFEAMLLERLSLKDTGGSGGEGRGQGSQLQTGFSKAFTTVEGEKTNDSGIMSTSVEQRSTA